MGRKEEAVEELRTLTGKLETFMKAIVADNESTKAYIDSLKSLLRKACSAEFCLRRRGERGQRTGRSVRRMAVTATVAGEPETRGFMEPACR